MTCGAVSHIAETPLRCFCDASVCNVRRRRQAARACSARIAPHVSRMQPFRVLLVAPEIAHCSRFSTSLFATVCATSHAQKQRFLRDVHRLRAQLARIQFETSHRNLLAQAPPATWESLQNKALCAVAWSSLYPGGQKGKAVLRAARQSNQRGKPSRNRRCRTGHDGALNPRRLEGKFRSKAVREPHQMAKHLTSEACA